MADHVTMDADFTALEHAIDAAAEAIHARTMPACKETTDAIVREARARLSRQLSSNATGKTAEGIHAIRAYDGNGYVVLSDRGAVQGADEQIANLPLWLEKGTRPGARHNYASTRARLFFYASIELEAGPHERRILDALRAGAHDVGLGE